MEVKEIWKDVEGYENLYQVSNLGRIKSLGRKGCGCSKKDKILKTRKYKAGYIRAGLCKKGSQKTFLVHRLVALAFLENSENKPCVDHINTIKTDNRVENLRWVTHSENNLNSITRKKYSNNMKMRCGKNHPMYGKHRSKESKRRISLAQRNDKNKSKAVGQFDLQGNLIQTYPSTMEIQRKLGYGNSKISDCCRGKYKKMYNYIWKYI